MLGELALSDDFGRELRILDRRIRNVGGVTVVADLLSSIVVTSKIGPHRRELGELLWSDRSS